MNDFCEKCQINIKNFSEKSKRKKEFTRFMVKGENQLLTRLVPNIKISKASGGDNNGITTRRNTPFITEL